MTRFEQPTFGANYLTFEVKPSANGGLTGGTKVDVRFKDRAMFEFVSLLEKSRERAIYMKRQIAEDEEGLRTFTLRFPPICVLIFHFRSHIYHARGIEHRLLDWRRPGRKPSKL